MKVLILGLNYAPEPVGVAIYTTGMAEALAAMGHEVEVIAGKPYYPAWKVEEGHRGWIWTRTVEMGVSVTRVPHYVPSKPTGMRRLLHQASFAASAALPAVLSTLLHRPDTVIAIAPSLLAAPIARLAAWLSGARSWLHIQDLEVEAAFATGLLHADGPAARIAKAFDRVVTDSFDVVSTISPQMARKLVEKGISADKIVELPNWADPRASQTLPGPSSYRAEWQIATQHIALYSGSIGHKQGLGIVIDAARLLAHRKDLTFVVCGNGPARADLEAQAAGLGNIRFQDLQPSNRLSDLVGLATIHLLPQLAGAADLVLPSKLSNMLASGRPVISTADPGTGLADAVMGCGIVTPPGDATAFADAIASLIDDPLRHAMLSQAARQRAETRWSGDAILARFAATLLAQQQPQEHAQVEEMT